MHSRYKHLWNDNILYSYLPWIEWHITLTPKILWLNFRKEHSKTATSRTNCINLFLFFNCRILLWTIKVICGKSFKMFIQYWFVRWTIWGIIVFWAIKTSHRKNFIWSWFLKWIFTISQKKRLMLIKLLTTTLSPLRLTFFNYMLPLLTPKVLCFFFSQNCQNMGYLLKLGNWSKSKEFLHILTVRSCSYLV
jgi:hypothetical protein